MKAPSSLICVAALSSALMVLVDARPMHADIEPHYQRYLQEKDAIQSELDEWMDEFKDQADANGLIPVTESRSTEDIDEERRQRFFLTKEKIKTLEQENPDATFSTKSPFTLLTDDEFRAYVHEAYRKADDARRLRGGNWWDDEPEDASSGNKLVEGNRNTNDDEKNGKPHRGSHSWWNSNKGRGAAAGDDDKVGNEFDFSSLSRWRPAWRPSTVAPARPSTAAPAGPSNDDVDDDVASDATNPPAPIPVVPVTSQPTTTEPLKKPTRAPSAGPVSPVGPVAPADSGTSASTSVAVKGVDWSTSPCVASPQNQGQCGSCWAFATVAAVEAGQCLAKGDKTLIKYSEQQLTSCDTEKNLGCNGGAPAYAYQYIQKNGLCTLSAYPYSSGGSGTNGACIAGCTKTATGLTGFTRITTGETGLVDALKTHPVVIAVAAGNNVWKQYTGGVVSSCQSSQLDHAVLAVGYDDSVIKIKNSWGVRWGEGGYIRLKRTGTSPGTCSMYQDMSTPRF
ncbi:hypothetical protein PybrP1_008998 [[Pythium] brassicae (nom. inval.)]|nr:hypothetical protein PybrP1_008998 [[Pythium] brassicae (nom. inval.)]